MKTRPSLSLPILLIAVAGCGASESKEEAALRRIHDRPAPGYLRVVNLTGGDLPVTKNRRPLMANVASGEASRLVTFAPGKGSIQAGDREVSVDLKSGEGSTIVVYPSARPDTISGEIRRPAKENVRVYFAPGDGSVITPTDGIGLTGPTPSKITVGTKALTLQSGHYTVGGESVQIEDHLAYTFLFVPQKGKLRAFLMLNTPNDKPSGTGASAS